MTYLALGDSISIDRYTGVEGGGAASQLARRLAVDSFVDFTSDGCTTIGVLAALEGIDVQPDLITLTVGGNDLLFALLSENGSAGPSVGVILSHIVQIADSLANFECPVVICTVYDPTDGDDEAARAVGIDPRNRKRLLQLNAGIRAVARNCGFLLADLHKLFQGHGESSPEPWLTKTIEPNLAGASAIAAEWESLLRPILARHLIHRA